MTAADPGSSADPDIIGAMMRGAAKSGGGSRLSCHDYKCMADEVLAMVNAERRVLKQDAEHNATRAEKAEVRVGELERENTKALAEVVGWHGIFAAVAAHLGCNARGTATGNDHVIARAKFASECMTALWRIATSADADAGLDPHGFANRVIHPPAPDCVPGRDSGAE